MQPDNSGGKKWYHTPVGIILILIIFFPIGLYLMWRYAPWSPKAKGITTAIVLGAFGLVSLMDTPDTPKPAGTNVEAPKSVTVASQEPTSTPEPTPVEQREVVVTSQIVKRVDGKYRYFFDIRNNDTQDFSGEVNIQLLNTKGQRLGDEDFSSTRAIAPKLGSSVYLDINTAPEAIGGELGIRTFKYEVKVDGNVVNSGEGAISEQFENVAF